MSQNVTAINVFVEIDGKQYLTPVKAEMASIFIGMLSAYQGRESEVQLYSLPPAVTGKLLETRAAIKTHLERPKEQV